ncbi:hypothetical protein UC35_02825 [Ramlibacter tataouinensis]|uniref:Uncharacterized protein n=2 Tax=Ramlibacter tataouinensis TaxID=94132 RepID=A0A127JQ31_9BURK|nr:hypothetical protein UC35_02825 [Ramlibacter tataouinensis]
MGALGAGGPAAADNEAYKCGPNSYSQHPCSQRKVNTEEYQAPAGKKTPTGIARRLPGETEEEFTVRRRRVNLPESDQDECKRLDTKIPFEQERLKRTVRPDEATEARASIDAAQKRFSQLKC